MAITTYSELTTALGNWLNRSDLDSLLPDFISLFEARMNRLIRTPEMEATVSTATSEGTVALPADFLSMRECYIDANPDIVLEPMTPAALRARYPTTATGTPAAYSIRGTDIILGPTPSEALTIKLSYYQKVPPLTSTNTTNWLLDSHPDAYLYGSLCMAEAYVQNDERLNVWKAAWDEVLGELMNHSARMRVQAAPLAMRPSVAE